jgi:hypothetical protein
VFYDIPFHPWKFEGCFIPVYQAWNPHRFHSAVFRCYDVYRLPNCQLADLMVVPSLLQWPPYFAFPVPHCIVP